MYSLPLTQLFDAYIGGRGAQNPPIGQTRGELLQGFVDSVARLGSITPDWSGKEWRALQAQYGFTPEEMADAQESLASWLI
jgi:hypothetical protein